MKKTFFVILLTLASFPLFSQNINAENFLYVSTTCPHCHNVEQKIVETGEDKLAEIVLKTVDNNQENYNSFLFALEKCGIGANEAGVPLLFSEDKCYMGEIEVLDKIALLADNVNIDQSIGEVKAEEITSTVSATPIPIVDPGIPVEEAKTNTLIFIAGMAVALALLVAVGYWKQSGESSKKAIIAFLVTTIASLNFLVLSNPLSIRAFCPVCTIAVGAGLGVSQQLGIDDVITSLWIGGLLVSMSLWLIEWLDKKKIRFLFRKPLIFILMYGLVIWPLSASLVIGASFNTLWGVDKVLLGIIIGTFGFIFGYILSTVLTKRNNDTVYFPFQKVVLPLSMLIILSLIFFFIVY